MLLTICISNHICQVKLLPGTRKGPSVTIAVKRTQCSNVGGVEVDYTYLELYVLAAV